MTRTFAPAAVVAALLLLLPGAQARVIQAETVLPPGQSGFVPTSGSNPHLTDQLALYQSFAFKPAGFDLPGTTEPPFPGVTITRDAYGVPNVHAANDADAWKGVGYAMAQDRLVQLELFRRATEGRLAEVLGPPGSRATSRPAATTTRRASSSACWAAFRPRCGRASTPTSRA
jgi:penicillin G amidase